VLDAVDHGTGQYRANVFLANMMAFSNAQVVSQKSGGTSEGNPGAGTSTSSDNSIGGAV
jgi:hypothetical protein